MAHSESRYHGLLVVDKPGLPLDTGPGCIPDLPTSHDVVQRVRRWSRQRRIGHTGTLDPMASGVLVLCLGVATRLVEYYQGHDKAYEAQVTLGRATDTYDALGQTVAEQAVPDLTTDAIEAVLARFRGVIQQKPPAFSALKQGGESLHRKARRGETVTVTSRPVTIHALRRLDFLPPDRLRLYVACSAGTYIRSLAHDLGAALGTVGHLSYLRRTAVGAFRLADAYTLAAVEGAATAGALQTLLLPPGAGLSLPCLPIPADARLRLGQGQKVWIEGPDAAWSTGQLVQALDERGRFLGILRALAISGERDRTLWKAEKWLAHHLQP